jgi:hypothetical protein
MRANRKSLWWVFSCVLVSAPIALAAQQIGSSLSASSPPVRDAQAMAVLQQSLIVMGGPILATIQDTSATLQVTTFINGNPSVAPATIKTLGRDKFRMDYQSPDGPATFVVNGSQASLKLATGELDALPVKSNFDAGIVHLPALSMLADWVAQDMRLEYIGLEPAGSASFHHIRLTRPSPVPDSKELESPCDIYVNSKTFLVEKLVYLIRQPTNLRHSEPMEVSYSDYRSVSGLAVPFHVTFSIRQKPYTDYQLTGFAVNRGTLQTDFTLR